MSILVFFFKRLSYNFFFLSLGSLRSFRLNDYKLGPKLTRSLTLANSVYLKRGALGGKPAELFRFFSRLCFQGLGESKPASLLSLSYSLSETPGNVFSLKKVYPESPKPSELLSLIRGFCFLASSRLATDRAIAIANISPRLVSVDLVLPLALSLVFRPSLRSLVSLEFFFSGESYRQYNSLLRALDYWEPKKVYIADSLGDKTQSPSLSKRPLTKSQGLSSISRECLPRRSTSGLGFFSYFTGWLDSESTSIFFLRANNLYNKSRYSRNRQTYRTGVY